MVYIYYLKCPITNKLRYIGRTIDLKTRIIQHMTNNPQECTKEKRKWIDYLKKRKLRPIAEIIEITDAENARAAEAKWIRTLREKNIRLFNSKHFNYYK